MERNKKLSRRDFVKFAGLSTGTFGASRIIRFSKENESGFSYEGVRYSFSTDRPIYALTIDGGWFPEAMSGILDTLKEKRARATFFLIGMAVINLENHTPGVMQRIVKDGHSIGYHTMKHEQKDILEKKDYVWWTDDFNKWWKLMRYYLGADLATVGLRRQARAPYGLFTDEFKKMCEKKQLDIYGWNIGLNNVQEGRRLHRGDILLLHITNKDLEVLRNGIKTSGRLIGTSLDCFENEDMCQPKIAKREQFEKNKWQRLFKKLELSKKIK
jgi:peptidoglycan/xylan/chitin deacetylase (PgdA/CDA1 family)